MKRLYEEAITFFSIQGKEIIGVYDLIVRGSARNLENCIPLWSDLDLTIVVEVIDFHVCEQIRLLLTEMEKKFALKISLTLVSKLDFFRTLHHHGTKALYYSGRGFLANSTSLMGNLLPKPKVLRNEMLKFDCLANNAFLIHDLRKARLTSGDDLKSLVNFYRKLIIRTNHLVRNSIFIQTDEIKEYIDEKLFKQCFPTIDADFPQRLLTHKKHWPSVIKEKNKEKIKEIVSYIFSINEKIYEITISHAESWMVSDNRSALFTLAV